MTHAARTVSLSQDITAPTLSSATVTGTSLVLTFSEDLGAAANLATSAFTVKVGGAAVSLSGTPVISGPTVTVTLATAVMATDTVTVAYTQPGSGSDNTLVDNTLVDKFGNEVATFTDQPVTVTRAAPTPVRPPTASSGGGGGTSTGGGGGPASTEEEPELIGNLENPGADSFQSGLGIISGWVCAADAVEIELNGMPQAAAYGTERRDTAAVCGDTDNGFGLLVNWNLLGDGEHEVVAFVDDVEFGRATVTVTTLGEEFLRDVTGECEAPDFPLVGETVTVVWQQTQQNFVLAGGSAPSGTSRAGVPGVGYLENPGPNSFQSGIGVISGWVCEGDAVEIEIGALGTQPAAYGTERLDTLAACGDTDNGFGLLFNWNLLGEGEHEVVAFVDGVELGRATVRVTTLGEEFLRGVEGECVVADFPGLAQTVTLEWQQNSQNFVITDVE